MKEIESDEMRRKVEQMETLTARNFGMCNRSILESISQTDRLFLNIYYTSVCKKLLKE